MSHDAHTHHAESHSRKTSAHPSTHDGAHHGHAGHGDMAADFKRRFFIALALTVPILLLSPMIQEAIGLGGAWSFPGDLLVLLGLSAAIYGYGGWPFLKGFVSELRDRRPGMMTLVAMAISVAFFYSAAVVIGLDGKLFFWETATLIDLMLLGHWIEMRSVMGASRALEELARLMPADAHRIDADGSVVDIRLSDLKKGDRVLVKSGEKIPADGDATEGESSVNESMLTGESRPVKKTTGDGVIAGSVNGQGSLTVEVKKTGEESYLNQVIDLVKTAQASKSRTQNLADRAALWLTVVALSVGAVTFVAWFIAAGRDLAFSIERAVTVMVVACPHALGLAIPLVVAVSTSAAARRGLLIRNRTAFEQARLLDTMVFDKTGTLTEGRFGVTDILVYDADGEDEVLRLAAGVERGSEHPIAAGILHAAEERGIDAPASKGFTSITGQGVQADIDGRRIRVLSPGAIASAGLSPSDGRVDELGRQGKTVVYLVGGSDDEAELLGALALADVIRPSAREAIERLHAMGIDAVMLTGDRQEVADYVAGELGIDRTIAEVLPDEKSAKIKALQDEGRRVAMTGDGVNDAPALATADVGMAIGAGTDVAIEAADMVLVDSDPRDAVRVIALAKATYRKMIQNLWYAAGYNIVALPLAAGVLAAWGIILSPAVGAVLMSLSTVVVAINARILRVE
ncbi:MAG: copper-translocating P-type ATPase [Rhodothermales bacterium]